LISVCNPIKEHHTGGCIGADEEYIEITSKLFPDCTYHEHPCNIPGMRSYFDPGLEHIIYDEKPPLDRNHDIVDAVEIMIGTPKTEDNIVRSGTWATIRYSRRVKRKIIVIFPNGGIQIENIW
jgi:hypothetical protein